MKKTIIILFFVLATVGFGYQKTEKLLLTPAYAGKVASATIEVIGLGNVVSVNGTAGLNLKPGSGGINVTGNMALVGTLNATILTGTLSTAAQPNITSLGTISNLTATTINATDIIATGISRIGSEANNTSFSGTGFITLTGNAMAWDDIALVPIISAKATGAGSLTLTTITGNIQAYAMSIDDRVMINTELRHDWKIGTAISPHLHIIKVGAGVTEDRFVKYQLEYAFVDITGNVSAATIVSNNFTVPANSPAGSAFYVELGLITPPTTGVSVQFMCKLSRVAATGTAIASDPVALNFGIHGQVNKLGSQTEYN